MSRLIDADKLIEDVLNSMPIGSARGVFRAFIEGQPTAFDVDKVVSELETRRKEYENEADKIDVPLEYSCYFKGIMRGYEYSIDVIKAGGIDENKKDN